MSFKKIVAHRADIVQGQLRSGMRIQHRRLIHRFLLFGDRRFNRADPYVHTEGELGNSLSLSALTPHIPWERAYQSDAHPSAF